MTRKSEFQEVNRQLSAEERDKLGDPPTAEELLAYSRGLLPEAEEERIRDLLVAYPELARLYGAAFPEEGETVSQAELDAAWNALQRRLGTSHSATAPEHRDGQRGRILFRRYGPTSIAAMIAVVFFGLFVQAESRARYWAEQGRMPHVLAAPQELNPDGNRGPGAATLLRRDGDVYWLRPILINEVRYPHYRIELRDAKDTLVWSSRSAQPDERESFQIVVPHTFLRPGETYQLRIYGIGGDSDAPLGRYDLGVPAE